MRLKKRLPVGIEFYKDMIDKSYYYVDKTLIIKDLLDGGGGVNLFTRPRRFGKTLLLHTLRTFFELDMDWKGNVTDNRHYFEGTKIMEAGEEYLKHMGQYPVISLSLKSAKQPDVQMAYKCLTEQIAREFKRHRYVLGAGVLMEDEEEKYKALMAQRAQIGEYTTSLLFLSECLSNYHGKKVIILMDEYDVPLENAYFEGFYDEMTAFIRSLFESALKTNDCLELAVITGCLRISRESIFTGLNNLEIHSVLSDSFAEYFGFTSEEVRGMLEFYGITEKMDEAKSWYNGYLFGDKIVYNPWSVVNYVKAIVTHDFEYPRPYWSNTSSNSIIKELVENADENVKGHIEELIAGGEIEKPIHEDITYGEIHQNQDNLWNFLYFTGYLKGVSKRFEDNRVYLTLAIPNEEVRYIYRNTIESWLEQKQRNCDLEPLYEGIRGGDSRKIEEFINGQLAESISYYDSAENFYHGYMLGLLSFFKGYEIKSNREQGEGRPDIVLKPFVPQKPAIILELKRAQGFEQMDRLCEEALAQIEKRQYAEGLFAEGYQEVMKYGICFYKKNCRVNYGKTERRQ